MIKLEKPKISQENIVNSCSNKIRDEARNIRITNLKKTILNYSNIYDEYAVKGELQNIEYYKKINEISEDMIWLYENKLVKGSGRVYYDALRAIPENGICPYCGKREVSTVDHYLAKSEYPIFAITKYNLIGVCSDCNKIKGNIIYNNREEELVHPYYDDFNDEMWLEARVINGDPIAFEYYINENVKWNIIKKERIRNHFNKLKLNELYSINAITRYLSEKKLLEELEKKNLLIDMLEQMEESARNHRYNSWEAAMYRALINRKNKNDEEVKHRIEIKEIEISNKVEQQTIKIYVENGK